MAYPVTIARCDNCGSELGCAVDSVLARRYFRLLIGLEYCDECLIAKADDFAGLPPAERILALRLLHVGGIDLQKIRATIVGARNTVTSEQLGALEADCVDMFELHRAGELVGVMLAGQALFDKVSHLAFAVKTLQVRRVGELVKAGGKKGAGRQRTATKRKAILEAARSYQGCSDAKIATIARKTRSSQRYVRHVLNQAAKKSGNQAP